MLLDLDFPADERVDKEANSLIKAGHDVTICCTNFNKRECFMARRREGLNDFTRI